MYKNKISGVYKITNKITGDFYIGSSKNIKERWAAHKSPSIWKEHPNSKLYKDMAQYGRENFIFEVIEKTNDLRIREQNFIEQFKPVYNSVRATGLDTERIKDTKKRCDKAYYQTHRDEHLAKCKAYYQTHREEYLVKNKIYCSRLCIYKSETLTLKALTNRFFRQGIPHARVEAKKYLIGENNNEQRD